MKNQVLRRVRSFPIHALAKVARFFALLPLRFKVGLITIVSTFIVCSVTAYVILTSYEKERVTYVFETHQHAVEAAAANINSSIRSKLSTLPFETLDKIPDEISRVPDSTEFIFAVDPKSRGTIVYGRDSKSNLVKYRLPKDLLLSSLSQVAHQRILLVSQEGTIFAATQDKKPQGKMKDAILDYLGSGTFIEGTSLINLNGYRTAVSHMELRDSNLIVLALTNIDSITQDLLKTVARWLLIALPIFAFSAFFQSAYIGKITAPLYALIDRFKEISLGNFDVPPEIPEGEFQPVMLGAAKMQLAIKERENRLGLLSLGLRKLMEVSQNRREFSDNLTMVSAIIDAVNPMLSRLKPTPALWIDLSTRINYSFSFQGTKSVRRVVGSEEKLNLDYFKQVFDSVIVLSDTIQITPGYSSEKTYVMVVPFSHDGIQFGFLLLPLRSGLYQKELDEFAQLIFRTVESAFIEKKAEELKISSVLLSNELALARSIQEKTISVHGEIQGAEVEWLFNPAQVVGGDLLMIYQYPRSNIINFYLGDVTGHGVDSAFLTALAAGAIEFYEGQIERQESLSADFIGGKDLSMFSKFLSDLLLNKGNGKLMSLCAGTFFANSGELLFVLAGHPPPLILDSAFKLKTVPGGSKSTLLIGDMSFPATPSLVKVKLEKGDSVFIYTDGLIENVISKSGDSLSRKKLSRKLTELYTLRREGKLGKNELPKVLLEWTKGEGDSYAINDDVAVLVIHNT